MNPKDAEGRRKASLTLLPFPALFEVARAAEHGARKYGPRNWRDEDITASIYIDAAMRHLAQWWEGEETAGDSGVHHLAHACAGLLILMDALERDCCHDDRDVASPPETLGDMVRGLQ